MDIRTPDKFESKFPEFFLDYVDESEKEELLVFSDRTSWTNVEFSRSIRNGKFHLEDWSMAVWFGKDVENCVRVPVTTFKDLRGFLYYVQNREDIRRLKPVKMRE